MLCSACKDIFSRPRRLAYGSIHPWEQTPLSFRLALQAGCHLCHLIDASRGYDSARSESFPLGISYSFRPLNPKWARYGTGMKWYTYQSRCADEVGEMDEYLRGWEQDPTPNGLGRLLATDSARVPDEAAKSWVVLRFYGCEDIVLPIELSIPDDNLEDLAQRNLHTQTTTGHPETLQLAKEWLWSCLDSHPSCGPRYPSTEDFVPTRLLDIGTIESPLLRLVSGASLDPKSRWVALSHRWATNQIHILRSSKVAAYHIAIPPSEVSPTIRDATHVTRALGIRYLWVDCMCIIQDDGSADWARESNTMSKIYGRSTCTIAAATTAAAAAPATADTESEARGGGGFFAERSPYRVRPCVIRNPFKSGDSRYQFNVMPPYLNRLHDENVRSSEWFKRGWVFQERMLAPRLLVFSDTQILWGCSYLQAAESWPRGKTAENYIDRFESVATERKRLQQLLHQETGVRKNHKAWWTFLRDYMASELTVRSDRLPAISGVAALVEGLSGERYCGGLWITAEDLPEALLWQVGNKNVRRRPPEYRAPSFSWAKVEGEICLKTGDLKRTSTSLVRVIEGLQLEDAELSGNTTGRNVREALRMEGILLPASVLTSSDGGIDHRILTREAGVEQASIIQKELEYAQSRRGQIEANVTATITVARKRASRFRTWITTRISHIWESYLRWVLLVIGTPILFVLAVAAFGLAIGLAAAIAGLAIVVVPVGAALYFSVRFCSNCWTMYLYPYFFAEHIRREEAARVREKMAHEEDMRRRQRKAEERAERVFADLERGVRFEDPMSLVEAGRKLNQNATEDMPVKIYLRSDFLLSDRQVMEVFVLPVLRKGKSVEGLVVCLVGLSGDRYERLGTFEMSDTEVAKFPHPKGDVRFLLV
ncbi:uncharacterized protein NECHADRAFT_85196 [Fusarium vanettenii 77-13-4]|uniref:Heterokaryon incompatibility domain-containing protein n=1 Tax=Fusarium vanettenii (strain ATCC MYA-4622 / CBS 123669 / FGSC 9596 / NRRL 45880 / 77-13-4) TaxID=660122 RepID=C7YV95_FUSV7|nr:uncharacterized protein NECHADRAFT_85196 [Fusarium vanettenii 77-13-4]EEU44543.1 predicted protein [Fusarium vanettenii 77-13-4]